MKEYDAYELFHTVFYLLVTISTVIFFLFIILRHQLLKFVEIVFGLLDIISFAF